MSTVDSEKRMRELADKIRAAYERRYSRSDVLESHYPVSGGTFREYQVCAEIGAGTFARVYEVRRVSDGQIFALSMLLPQWVDDPTALNNFCRGQDILRFFRESGVSCPHIVTQYTYGELQAGLLDAEIPYSVLERLQEAFPQGRNIAGREFFRYLSQIASGLLALHGNGIIHRDVKPENIMLNALGEAVLVDFNVAYVDNPAVTGLTSKPGDQAGTPPYMSPQQARSEKPLPAEDIFCLAATVYRKMTGMYPYEAETEDACLDAAMRGAVRLRWPAGIPAKLRRLVTAGLSPQRAKRPSMKTLFQAFRRLERQFAK